MDDRLKLNKDLALKSLNQLFKETANFFTLEYKILIYRLLTNGHVKTNDLSQDSGLSRERLYKMVEDVKNYLKDNEEIQNTNT